MVKCFGDKIKRADIVRYEKETSKDAGRHCFQPNRCRYGKIKE
jgi:hypothetical protein